MVGEIVKGPRQRPAFSKHAQFPHFFSFSCRTPALSTGYAPPGGQGCTLTDGATEPISL